LELIRGLVKMNKKKANNETKVAEAKKKEKASCIILVFIGRIKWTNLIRGLAEKYSRWRRGVYMEGLRCDLCSTPAACQSGVGVENSSADVIATPLFRGEALPAPENRSQDKGRKGNTR